MTPTIVLGADGEPVLSIGAAGGPTILTQVLLGLLYTLEHDLTPSAAVAQPRFHHQWRPDRVRLERAALPALAAELRARGHEIKEEKLDFGTTQIIRRLPDGTLVGAYDPRAPGAAEGKP